MTDAKLHFERRDRLDIENPFPAEWFPRPSKPRKTKKQDHIQTFPLNFITDSYFEDELDDSDMPDLPDRTEIWMRQCNSRLDLDTDEIYTNKLKMRPDEWSILTVFPKYITPDNSIMTNANRQDRKGLELNVEISYDMNDSDTYEGVEPTLCSYSQMKDLSYRDTISISYLGNDDEEWGEVMYFPIDRNCMTEGTLGSEDISILVDTGASASLLNKSVYDKLEWLHEIPKIPVRNKIWIKMANEEKEPVEGIIQIPIKIGNHKFKLTTMIVPVSKDLDVVLGFKAMVESEVDLHTSKAEVAFRTRLAKCRICQDVEIPPHRSAVVPLQADTSSLVQGKCIVHFTGCNHADTSLVYFNNNIAIVKLYNNTDQPWKFKDREYIAGADLRSQGYYDIPFSSMIRLLEEEFEIETLDSLLDILIPYKDLDEMPDYPAKDPYPWLDPKDPRRHKTDEQIIRESIVLDNSMLTPDEKEKVYSTLMNYRDAFSLRDEIGLCPSIKVRLQLKDETPFYIRPYPIKLEDKPYVEKEIQKLVSLGVLKKGLSGYSSPIMLIPRKNSRIPRIVSDFRVLNTRLVRVNVAFPLVKDVIQEIGDAQPEVISVIDLRDAYHTLRLEDESKQFCGIIPYHGSTSYLYQRLGMGLSVSPAIWQAFINLVLDTIPDRDHHIAIMDDCLVHSHKQEHLDCLVDLFKALIKQGLKISPRKCQLYPVKIQYMGSEIEITPKGIQITPLRSRVEALEKVNPPTDVAGIRRFCGLVNWLAAFLPHLREMLVPFYDLTKRKATFKWTPLHQTAFEGIKETLCNYPVVYMPNSTDRFQVYSDTSQKAAGSSLWQIQKGGTVLIGYASKRLSDAATRYSITELELTGMLLNITAYETYVWYNEFDVIVDHSAIPYIMKSAKCPRTLRLAKLLEKLSRYKFVVFYNKGKTMFICDFLSRHSYDAEKDIDIEHPGIPVSVLTRAAAKKQGIVVPSLYPQNEPKPPSSTPVIPPTNPPNNSIKLPTTPQLPLPTELIDTPIWSGDSAHKALPPRLLPLPQLERPVQPPKLIPPPPEYSSKDELIFDNPKPIVKTIPKQKDLNRLMSKLHLKKFSDLKLPLTLRDIKNAYASCPTFKHVYTFMTTGKAPPQIYSMIEARAENFAIIDGLLYYKLAARKKDPKESDDKYYLKVYRLCIPDSHIDLILFLYHDTLFGGHQGVNRMCGTINKHFYIPHLEGYVRQYKLSCLECQLAQKVKPIHRVFVPRIPVDYIPLTYLSMDFKEMPGPPKHMLVFTCELTGYVVTHHLYDKTAITIAQALLDRVVRYFCTPQVLIHDEDPPLASEVMKMVYHKLDIERYLVSVENHGSLKTERYIGSLQDMYLKFLTGTGTNWFHLLPAITMSHNITVNSRTGYSPYELVFGRKPPTPGLFMINPANSELVTYGQYNSTLKERFGQLSKFMLDYRSRQQELQNAYAPIVRYKTGDLVFLIAPRHTSLQSASKKLSLHLVGPLVVHTVLDNHQYALAQIDGKVLNGMFAVNRLRPAFLRTFNGVATNINAIPENAFKDVTTSQSFVKELLPDGSLILRQPNTGDTVTFPESLIADVHTPSASSP